MDGVSLDAVAVGQAVGSGSGAADLSGWANTVVAATHSRHVDDGRWPRTEPT